MSAPIPPTERDPKIDPRPGDEFASMGRLKARVIEVTFGEAGITHVRYRVGRYNEEYWDTICGRSLEDWQYFIKDATEVTSAAS
jgi:hypothetical protein